MAGETKTAGCPVRSFMDDPGIKWRHGKPDYAKADDKFMRERSKKHADGSVEKLVEDLVKTWEMEERHKFDVEQWKTTVVDKFRGSVNGGRCYSAKELWKMGNYNVMLADSPLYKDNGIENDRSHDMFLSVFGNGFAWELLEILAGPPKAVFTWRHWGEVTGSRFDGSAPSGKLVELFGVSIVTLNSDSKVTDLESYFDPSQMLIDVNGENYKK